LRETSVAGVAIDARGRVARRLRPAPRETAESRSVKLVRMSRLIARILLAIFLIPLASLVYLVTFYVHDRMSRTGYAAYYRGEAYPRETLSRESWGFLTGGAVSWAFIALWWFLLWRKSERWTGERIGYTLGVAVAVAIAGVALASMIGSSDQSFGVFVGSAAAPMLWLVGSIFVWRETAGERAARAAQSPDRAAVACPTCGYNLTGLREARCPECGSQFTVDQLLAAQRASGGGGGGGGGGGELDG
jgi:hypothetical protein